MISPLPGVTAAKPGSAMRPLPGIAADVVDDDGEPVPQRRRRLPGAHRAVAVDAAHASGATTSATRTPTGRASQGLYFAGDGAKKDDDGDIWLLGRVDDVMNVSGHRHLHHRGRVGAGLAPEGRRGRRGRRDRRDHRPGHRRVRHPARSAPRTASEADELIEELRDHVAKEIGPIAKPRQILIVAELPKTRSGKIMRRLLRDVAENRELGDVTTLADSTVMDLIKRGRGHQREVDSEE